MAAHLAHHGRVEALGLGELQMRRQIEVGRFEGRTTQGLHEWSIRAPRPLLGHHGGESSACAVSCQCPTPRVGSYLRGVGHGPVDRRNGVVYSGGEWVLGGKAVVARDDHSGYSGGQQATDLVVGVQVSGHESGAVDVAEQRKGLFARPINPDRDSVGAHVGDRVQRGRCDSRLAGGGVHAVSERLDEFAHPVEPNLGRFEQRGRVLTPPEQSESQVVIAGGGPVGLVLAMDLARYGIKTVVLEQRKKIPPNPRCNTTNARSMELLRRLGCADAVRSAGLPSDHNTDVVYMTRFNGHELTRYHRSTTDEVRAGTQHGVASNWPTPEPQHYLSQIYLEPILLRHAVEYFGVDVREGWALESFTQDEDGVTSVARDTESGDLHSFRSQYMVGADGSDSMVRQRIGARLEGIPQLGQMCSTFVRSKHLEELSKATPGWMLRFIGGGVLVAIDGAELWLLHHGVPRDEDLATYDPEPAMFAAIGEPFDYEILGRARWTPRAMVATKFGEGRVLLAGDAAHLWIPMGGFGMNAGIVDAVSLSWRLAGVLDGWADEKLLDSYESERAPLGGAVASQAAQWARDIGPLTRYSPDKLALLEASEDARAELGEEIRSVNLGEFECPGFQLGYLYEDSPVICHDPVEAAPPLSLETYHESTWPGARLPHMWLSNGESLFDRLGVGFTLLRLGIGAPPGGAMVIAADRLGVPLDVVDLVETDAKYGGYGLVLVRPDQHVVWRSRSAPTLAEAEETMARVVGRRSPERQVTEIVAERIAGGFLFGEGPRMFAGDLVFSDMIGKKVLRWDRDSDELVTLFEVEGQPNGLSVLPDGRLVIASMFDGCIYVADGDRLELYADLSDVVTGYLGDMAVDAVGRIYVDDTGSRVLHGEPLDIRPGRLLMVDEAGRGRVVIENLSFPNGLAISSDGQMLMLVQSGLATVEQCRIAANGDLGELRPFARQLGDGLAIEPDGGLWVCDPGGGRGVARYDKAGRLTARVVVEEADTIACAVDTENQVLYIVGIERLARGVDLFEEMAAGRTRGVLWKAELADL